MTSHRFRCLSFQEILFRCYAYLYSECQFKCFALLKVSVKLLFSHFMCLFLLLLWCDVMRYSQTLPTPYVFFVFPLSTFAAKQMKCNILCKFKQGIFKTDIPHSYLLTWQHDCNRFVMSMKLRTADFFKSYLS